MTSRFTSKLDSLPETIRLVEAFDIASLAEAINDGKYRHAILVGSGGSVISAEFFARCRETLRLGYSSIETPMQFVLGNADIRQCDVWFFSASADNSDIIAAVKSAFVRKAKAVHIITRSPDATAAREIAIRGGQVYAVPVTEFKDGYLATHSMVSTITCLLAAADKLTDAPLGKKLLQSFGKRVEDAISPNARARANFIFGTLSLEDTIIIIADPQLRPISVLLETSAWETGLCPVQSTDFRNFAHGRHAWLHHRGDRSLVLALTGNESRSIWEPLENALPSNLRRATIDFTDCGRFANAVGIVEGLILIEAMGRSVKIDPAKPGMGPFGPEMYENGALGVLHSSMPSSIRHKRAAILKQDDPTPLTNSLLEIEAERLSCLANAKFGGIVLDYDGTIVRTDDRYSIPSEDIATEFERLHGIGLQIGIATGRGGSAGKDLRAILPETLHSSITMGYYNGGYIQPLDVDIKVIKALPNDGIDETIAWLACRQEIFRSPELLERAFRLQFKLIGWYIPNDSFSTSPSVPPCRKEE